MDFVMVIIEQINQGKFKPKENKSTKPNCFRNYVTSVFRTLAHVEAKQNSKMVSLQSLKRF